MSSPAIDPIFQPKVKVGTEVREERQTIVHCRMTEGGLSRIWGTTYLIQDDGEHRKLLCAYGISQFPQWCMLEAGDTFTLVFEGLSRGCTQFDMFEDIPEPGGFFIEGIQRNAQDVYTIDI